MTFNRDSAFSLSLADPDFPETEQIINSAITVNNELYIFSRTAIFRMLSADTLDPERNHPDTMHSYEKIYSVGSEKLIVARTILQFSEIFRFLGSSDIDEKHLLSRLWICCQKLFICESDSYFIYEQTMKLMPECDRLIEKHKNTHSMPPLPKIPDIESRMASFFLNSKLMLEETFGFLHLFFKMPFDNKYRAHFDKHVSWLVKRFGKDHPLAKMISRDLDWIRILSECSNAMRHPESGQQIDIANICFRAGNRFSAPSWQYDLTKKGLGSISTKVDLVSDLDTFCHNMMMVLEELLLWSIDEVFKKSEMCALHQYAENEINPNCPVKYYVGVSDAFRKKFHI